MKFSDIKPFTKNGDYEVNISLKYLEKTLQEYEEDYGLELDPDFQRGHVWTEKQQSAFVEFFLKGGKTARIIYFNCPCFSGNSMDKSPMVCVDGLQRLTALRKFLRNELKIFGKYYINDFEDKDIMLRKIGRLRFNINDLKTRKEILQWYIDFNTGGTIHTNEEIKRVQDLLKKEDDY